MKKLLLTNEHQLEKLEEELKTAYKLVKSISDSIGLAAVNSHLPDFWELDYNVLKLELCRDDVIRSMNYTIEVLNGLLKQLNQAKSESK